MPEAARSFDLFGSLHAPASPVVLSVPHAGRDYPAVLQAALRVPLAALIGLEDRHVDQLVHAAHGAETLLIQRPARAWIDLNRAETERDPRIDDGADRRAQTLQSAKLRGGLGLVPRRLATTGALWRRRFGDAEMIARIAADHRPYHAALATALDAARRRFGIAVLLDVHSMPPLDGAEIVLGDRFGRSASARFVERIEAEVEGAGLRQALNHPYAGGHILDRHGLPSNDVHAVQIEWSRALYLDDRLEEIGPGLPRAAALLRRILDALADEAMTSHAALAAE